MPILIRSIHYLDEGVTELLASARHAFTESKPPGGGTAAGAALRGADDRIFVGAAAALDGGRPVCAEAAAVTAAQKDRALVREAALVCEPSVLGRNGPHGAFPCGCCRQRLADLANECGREIPIYMTGPSFTAIVLATTGELLPEVLSPLILRRVAPEIPTTVR